jgi:large subunit ribosomal protein L7/L12
MYIPIPIVIGAVALILVLLLMRRGRAGRRDLLEPPAAMQIPAVLADEARILLAQGDKIAAIELVREQSGLGLKESKDFVERLEPDS